MILSILSPPYCSRFSVFLCKIIQSKAVCHYIENLNNILILRISSIQHISINFWLLHWIFYSQIQSAIIAAQLFSPALVVGLQQHFCILPCWMYHWPQHCVSFRLIIRSNTFSMFTTNVLELMVPTLYNPITSSWLVSVLST